MAGKKLSLLCSKDYYNPQGAPLPTYLPSNSSLDQRVAPMEHYLAMKYLLTMKHRFTIKHLLAITHILTMAMKHLLTIFLSLLVRHHQYQDSSMEQISAPSATTHLVHCNSLPSIHQEDYHRHVWTTFM